jgi:ferrochelatase
MENKETHNKESHEDAQKISQKIGVILMTYGSATTAEGVREYMDHIYRGKAPEGVVEDFENRYRLVGHSPLVVITEKQASALEDFLNKKKSDGKTAKKSDTIFIVRAGMLHSKPFIETAIRECKDAGAEQLQGIILSPQFSSFIMDGYRGIFSRAAGGCGFAEGQFSVASPWPTEPHFIRLLAEHICTARAKIQEKFAVAGQPDMSIPIIFTTHSLPKRVVDKDPAYLQQLKATTDAVLAELNDTNLQWHSAYQSAGHTPEEWLKPDLTDILAKLSEISRKKRKMSKTSKLSTQASPAVLIAPIQFLTDHLEILYDLDIAARKQCEDFGIAYHRIELPNTDLLFIEALADLIQ